jgi:hypothetical protein
MLGQSVSVMSVSTYMSSALSEAHPITYNCAYSVLDELANKSAWTIYNEDYNSILSMFL